MSQFKTLGFDSVLCVGTPSLHHQISEQKKKGKWKLMSLLLDIDPRFVSGNNLTNASLSVCNSNYIFICTFYLNSCSYLQSQLYSDDFLRYNMCNHHFFEDSSKYKEFLSNSRKIALVMDPPFGVKVELLWHGCLAPVKRDFVNWKVQNTQDDTSLEGKKHTFTFTALQFYF